MSGKSSSYMVFGKHLVTDVEIHSRTTYRDTSQPYFLPAACRISNYEERQRIISVFIRNSTFAINSFRSNEFFRKFLASTPDGISHVRHLRFNFFDYFPPNIEVNSDLQLAQSCRGLRIISLAFGRKALGMDEDDGSYYEDSDPFALRSRVEGIVSRYKLEQLNECAMINKIFWRLKGYRSRFLEEVIDGVANWVKDEFAKKNQTITNEFRN
jgi:hypothetical protein